MVDRTYRSARDRSDRDRRYSRQAEQFDAADYRRDDERGYGQMGEGWRDEDYGQFDSAGQSYSRDREAARDWGRDPSYARRGEFRSTYASPRYSAERTFERGAGSQLAANHGEWHEGYGTTPSRDRGYRGQGPSGYTRSDERIMEDACDALTDDWGVDARQISVAVSNGDVTLEGAVPSREQKRRAEDCVDDLSGVKNVQNNLRVQERSEFGSQSNPTSSQA